jgi:hypothetical protein
VRKLRRSQLAQLGVNQRQQLLGSGGVARFDLRQDLSNVGHEDQDAAWRQTVPSGAWALSRPVGRGVSEDFNQALGCAKSVLSAEISGRDTLLLF